MTGNTWDWTSSLYTPYPYDAADGRETPSPPGARRVVRGGSWDADQVVARASSRRVLAPGDRLNLLGLRLVRSSHILIPLMAQPGGCLRIRLSRACSPAWLARAGLPVLAADYGWRPEAKVIKMAQVSPARTGSARQAVGPTQKRGVSWAHALRRLTWPSSIPRASGPIRPPRC
jgi:hypothetical protein